MDRSFVEKNWGATERIRQLASRLSDDQLTRPVGEHWTVAVALVHLAFWERRVLAIVEQLERDGRVDAPAIDLSVNDLSLPIWAAVPPRAALRLALQSADELDRRLAGLSAPLLEALAAGSVRWVDRSLHRNSHLDEIEEAL